MDFEVFWCKKKLRVCLFCFFCFQYTFVELKAPKTFSEVKSCVFFRAQIPKVEANLLVDAGGNTWKINDILREIKIVRSGSLNQQEKLLQTKYQLNRSIFATCMPKKIKNLGIKSLSVAVRCENYRILTTWHCTKAPGIRKGQSLVGEIAGQLAWKYKCEDSLSWPFL